MLVLVGCVVVAAVGGMLVPRLIRALPEPAPADADGSRPPYAEVAARPALGRRTSLASAGAACLVAIAVGPDWWLVVLVPLVPVCAALAVVDWHTKLLPTRIVLPATAYAVVVALAGWAVTGGTADVLRGALGLVLARSFFWLLWFVHSAGMGFGDVRLAGLLGVALGHLGWAELVVGLYAGFLVFGLPGLLLAVVRRDRRLLRSPFPFGPFLVAGALVGVVAGPWLASYVVGR